MKAAVAFIAGFTILALVGVYADLSDVWDSLGRFQWQYTPLLLLLTAASYAARFLRWQLALELLAGRPLSAKRKESAVVYVSGLAGLLTPLKAGEASRSYFAQQRLGVSPSVTLPILISERMLDSIAMVLLASIGLLLYTEILVVIGVVLGTVTTLLTIVVIAVFALRRDSTYSWLFRQAGKLLRRQERDADSQQEFARVMQKLLTLPLISLIVGFGVVSYAFQALVFFVVVVTFTEPLSLATLAIALFVYPAAMLVGTVSLLPFGLGSMDASMVLLSEQLMELSAGELLSAVIISRTLLIVPVVLTGAVVAGLQSMRYRYPA